MKSIGQTLSARQVNEALGRKRAVLLAVRVGERNSISWASRFGGKVFAHAYMSVYFLTSRRNKVRFMDLYMG